MGGGVQRLSASVSFFVGEALLLKLSEQGLKGLVVSVAVSALIRYKIWQMYVLMIRFEDEVFLFGKQVCYLTFHADIFPFLETENVSIKMIYTKVRILTVQKHLTESALKLGKLQILKRYNLLTIALVNVLFLPPMCQLKQVKNTNF